MNHASIVLLSCVVFAAASAQTTIEQRLVVAHNDATMGGQFTVAVYAKGTNLTAAATVASMTIDILFNRALLRYENATSWAFGTGEGYLRFVSNIPNEEPIRIGAIGSAVNGNGDGTPSGFDLTSTYQLIVELNFTILNPEGVADVTIAPWSNQIGFFSHQANQPAGGPINNQALNAPIVIEDEALPVELASFTAAVQSGGIRLEWKTATEVNNFGFEIERCIGDSWIKLGFVPGAGTSNTERKYAFTDTDRPAGETVKYRLKQIDRDGRYAYSTEVEVRPAAPKAYALYQNYPNPFNPSTTMYFDLPEESDVTLSVFNVLGAKVADAASGRYGAGRHAVLFRGERLASGLYFYRLSAQGATITKTMHLVK